MDKIRIDLPREKIEGFCRKWGITEFSFFGSVLRPDFSLQSDIDILVEFSPQAKHSLFDLVNMQGELGEIFGRKVDLLTRKAVEQSRNYIRRKAILSSLEPVYVS